LTSEYNGPPAGFTQEEFVELIGWAVIEAIEANGIELVWKKKID
jgi:hypothetical protein